MLPVQTPMTSTAYRHVPWLSFHQLFSLPLTDNLGEELDMDNVKEKLIKTVDDAKTVFQNYKEKCDAKEVLIEIVF